VCSRLKEEKLERRVKKELPAVIAKLRTLIKEYESKKGQQLIMNGKVLLHILPKIRITRVIEQYLLACVMVTWM
jgi:Skp family chaperone for outer membrane proteins